jgi:PAS domain S-box-containing protein
LTEVEFQEAVRDMRLRLETKAALFFCLLMAVSFGAALVFGFQTQRKSLLDMASQRYLAIAGNLGDQISESCEITDPHGLQSVIQHAVGDVRDVLSTVVVDSSGAVVAAIPQRVTGYKLPVSEMREVMMKKELRTSADLAHDAWTLQVMLPLMSGSGTAPARGGLYMVGSLQGVQDDLGALIRRQVTIFLILIGAGLLGTIVYLRRGIVRPIKELSNATRRVVAGDFRESGIGKTQDEIGDLAASFDWMTGELRKSQEFLKDYNLILMQMVASEQDRNRLDQVISSIAYALVEIDNQGNICRWNKAATEIFGLEPEDVLGHPLRDSRIPWDWQQVASLLDGHLDENQSWHRDGVPYDRPDQTQGYMTLTLSRVDSPDAGPDETRSAYVLLAADVTEQKQAADKVKRTLSLLRATIESTADGLLVVDRNGKTVISNKRFAEMWRIPEAVLASGDDEQALRFAQTQLRRPDEFLAKVRELYNQPDAESWDVLEFKDGRVFERYSRPQVINGTGVGRVWSFRDVSEVEFRSVFESSRDALMLLDREGFFDCNKATLELFGCSSKEQFTSRHPSELSPPFQPDGTDSLAAAQARIEAAFTEGGQFFEWMHSRLDGSLFPAEVLLSRFEFHRRTVLQATVRDVTEHRRHHGRRSPAEAGMASRLDKTQSENGQPVINPKVSARV